MKNIYIALALEKYPAILSKEETVLRESQPGHPFINVLHEIAVDIEILMLWLTMGREEADAKARANNINNNCVALNQKNDEKMYSNDNTTYKQLANQITYIINKYLNRPPVDEKAEAAKRAILVERAQQRASAFADAQRKINEANKTQSQTSKDTCTIC